MTRSELDLYIQKTYHVKPEHLFRKHPSYAIYRHPMGRKWFAAIMEIPKRKLGIPEDENITIVNVKLDPDLADLLRTKSGFFPAYHMNKENWISAEISDRTDKEKLYGLLSMSFRLTMTKNDKE